MNRKEQKRDDSVSRERLAHLGLAADRAGPKGNCPDDNRFTEMLDGEAGSQLHRSFFEHLSRCEICFQKWLVLSEELGGHRKNRAGSVPWFKRRPVLTGVGSACALALVMVLYLAIDYRPVLFDKVASQSDDQASIGSSIAEPGERGQVEADAEQRSKSRQRAASADTDLVPETRTIHGQAEAPKIEGQQPAVASAPAAPVRMQKEAASTAVDSAEHDRTLSQSDYADSGVPAPLEMSNRITMEAKQHRPVAGHGVVHKPKEYNDLIDRIAELCRSGDGVIEAADAGQMLKQARMLLAPEAIPAGESRKFIEYVVDFLEKERSIDDEKRGEFCAKAGAVIMEKQQSGDKPRSELQ